MTYAKSIMLIVGLVATLSAGTASACGMSGAGGDCAAACKDVPAGWQHTLCIIGATPPAPDSGN